ncbi:hypothetical protein San01_43890 [Streptomyces angustmyceticus]|uniref:Uncharacterized protein n=1 Tax=Streptomyces angustmyceticus TaxID=285578 RepID=A0A5J4LIP1_9ACTN|nr:hypothetical protein San01_43890 [Streptomyces angustmyceticus]
MVGLVMRKRDRIRGTGVEIEVAVGRQEGQGHGWSSLMGTLTKAVTGEVIGSGGAEPLRGTPRPPDQRCAASD